MGSERCWYLELPSCDRRHAPRDDTTFSDGQTIVPDPALLWDVLWTRASAVCLTLPFVWCPLRTEPWRDYHGAFFSAGGPNDRKSVASEQRRTLIIILLALAYAVDERKDRRVNPNARG